MLDLDAIEKRAEGAMEIPIDRGSSDRIMSSNLRILEEDIPLLIAEVERLRGGSWKKYEIWKDRKE